VAVEVGTVVGGFVAMIGSGAESTGVAGKLPQPVKRPSAIHKRRKEKKVLDIF
jgi:hypothetical protein